MNMRKVKAALVAMGAMILGLVFAWTPASATLKYSKETGKKCLDCHSKVPKKGEDPNLTELGKKFAENGHKLPK
ncbi:MAG: hypothetical protein AB1898_10035 [Acidobacteriota bacterium]